MPCSFGGLVFAVYSGIEFINKKHEETVIAAQEDSKRNRPVYAGRIIKKAEIPINIPLRAQQEHPYWVIVQTTNNEKGEELWKINFDTDDPLYDPSLDENPQKRVTIKVHIGAKSGVDYKNRALALDELLLVGCTVHFRTREQYGPEREAYEVIRVEPPSTPESRNREIK